MSKQSDLLQVELRHQRLQIRNVPGQRVRMPGRFVRQTASQMIDRNDSISIAQSLNNFPPGKRPRRIPVNAQNRFACPFFDVVNLLTINFDEMRLKRILIRKAVLSSKLVRSSHVPLSKYQSPLQCNSADHNF